MQKLRCDHSCWLPDTIFLFFFMQVTGCCSMPVSPTGVHLHCMHADAEAKQVLCLTLPGTL